MNLLSQFQQIFAENPKGFATITGIKQDGTLIATTPAGAVVLLEGNVDIGKNVGGGSKSRLALNKLIIDIKER